MTRDPQNTRGMFVLAVFALMYLAETFWPKRRRLAPKGKRLLFHGSLMAFNTLWTRLLVAGPLMLWVGFVWDRGWGASHFLGLSGTREIISTVVILDALNYWWHRWNHRVGFLWRFHKAHHLDTEVDTTTALRFHPGELLISYAVKCAWILLWGPSVGAFILFEALITAYSQFHHTNVDFPDRFERPLRWIHITPRLHAAHHTVSLRTRDANYSTIFSVWDRLFGSLEEPDKREMKHLGLKGGRRTPLSVPAFALAPFDKGR